MLVNNYSERTETFCLRILSSFNLYYLQGRSQGGKTEEVKRVRKTEVPRGGDLAGFLGGPRSVLPLLSGVRECNPGKRILKLQFARR
jgi:hypothetical protein